MNSLSKALWAMFSLKKHRLVNWLFKPYAMLVNLKFIGFWIWNASLLSKPVIVLFDFASILYF
jgi:hypothetical protein